MKKLTLTSLSASLAAVAIVAALTPLDLRADVLSPQEALNRVSNTSTVGSAPRRAAAATAGVRSRLASTPALTIRSAAQDPQIYVFTPTDGSGYMILSAESEAEPLLGYSDTEQFTPGNVPDGLQFMLDYYAAEINAVRASAAPSAVVRKARPERDAIAPICKTKWNQNAPYNNLCPTVGTTNCVTGCVATAVAQVLKTYEYPTQCSGGTYSYTWTANNNQTLSLNYDEVTLDWANMLDTYDASATDEQKNAVATLMKAVGYGVNMGYTTGESGAGTFYVPIALIRNFGYDSTATYENREWYKLNDWENKIYDVLEQNHGVIYAGQTAAGAGHCFVVDGYSSDGYFHINWGWGGLSDGYFLLSALDPDSQGIGGSTAGFDFSQGAVFNLSTTPSTDAADVPMLFTVEKLAAANETAYTNNYATFTGGLYNMGAVAVSGQTACKLVNTATGEEQYYPGYVTFEDMSPIYGYEVWSVTFPEVADGTYLMTMAVANSDGTVFYDAKSALNDDATSTLVATVSEGQVTFSAYAGTTASPTFTNVQIASTVIAPGLDLDVTATATNNTDAYYYGSVFAVLYASDETSTSCDLKPLDLEAGESAAFDYSITLPTTIAAGNYSLVFADAATGYACSEPVAVTVGEAPAAGVLSWSNPTMLATQPGNLQAKVTATCTSGYYNNVVYFALFTTDNDNSITMWATPKVKLNAGESVELTASTTYPAGTVGTTYRIAPYYIDANNQYAQFGLLYFTFTDFDLQGNSIEVTSTRIDNLAFDVNVTNNGDDFNDKIYLTISQGDNTIATFPSEAFELANGATTTVKLEECELPDGEVGSEYTVTAYHLDSLGNKKQMAASTNFVLTDILTSLRDVTADGDDTTAVEYFDLQGRRLGSLPASGVVIRRQGNTAEKIHL